mmetsp:Transcript_8168/g.20846  ORF Transcript_8168/g.20846 Transcript_8168/m.20846 type:complete len:302 (-) Transcript_8168:463-1368(-)
MHQRRSAPAGRRRSEALRAVVAGVPLPGGLRHAGLGRFARLGGVGGGGADGGDCGRGARDTAGDGARVEQRGRARRGHRRRQLLRQQRRLLLHLGVHHARHAVRQLRQVLLVLLQPQRVAAAALELAVGDEEVQPARHKVRAPHDALAQHQLHLQQQPRALAQRDDLDVLLHLLRGVAHERDERVEQQHGLVEQEHERNGLREPRRGVRHLVRRQHDGEGVEDHLPHVLHAAVQVGVKVHLWRKRVKRKRGGREANAHQHHHVAHLKADLRDEAHEAAGAGEGARKVECLEPCGKHRDRRH